MWNEAKWVCWFAPFFEPPRDTCYSGTALIFTWWGAAWCSHSRSVPLFWEQVVFVWVENIFVSLKAGPLPLLWGCRFLLCGVVVFLAGAAAEFEYLWACLAKATFIIIRLMCTPERQSQNHPESADWKQRWGPFSRRWSYISFYFWHGQLRLSTQTRTFILFVFRRDAGGKNWLVGVEMSES